MGRRQKSFHAERRRRRVTSSSNGICLQMMLLFTLRQQMMNQQEISVNNKSGEKRNRTEALSFSVRGNK